MDTYRCYSAYTINQFLIFKYLIFHVLNISFAYCQILYFFDENCTNVEIFDEINIV